jgi:hypothetical protein
LSTIIVSWHFEHVFGISTWKFHLNGWFVLGEKYQCSFFINPSHCVGSSLSLSNFRSSL